MALTIERYLKVVYPFWSKKTLKNWMIYVAIVFSWVAGILSIGPVGVVTSLVVEGTCLVFQVYFKSPKIRHGYAAWRLGVSFLFSYCS